MGLVVGKFCPLHKGHELLIGRALASCDRVIVMSYTNPEFPRCAPANRRRWLERLFPAATAVVLEGSEAPRNDAPEDVHRAFVARLLAERGESVDAVFTSESYGEGFAAFLSNAQGRLVAHVPVDPERRQARVSGTWLRESVERQRDWLSPVVRADMVRRVCVLGGESTGKTTLAEALAAALDEPWVAEYGREHWEMRNGILEFDDLQRIAEEQVRREEAAACEARETLVCDTSPLTTLFYSLDLFGQATPAVHALAARAYDVTLLCADDFAFDQDGTRRAADFRSQGQAWYRSELAKRGVAFTELGGSPQARLEHASRLLR